MKTLLYGFLLLVIGTVVLTSCKPLSANFILYKAGEIVPVIVIPTKPKGVETKALNLFVDQFKLTTGTTLKVFSEEAYKKNEKQVAIYLGNTKGAAEASARYKNNDEGFCIGQKDNNVYISYQQGLGILNGVATFFELYTNTFYIDQKEKNSLKKNVIEMPAAKVNSYTPAFKFRCAYFPQSLDYDYALWNKLHLIEEQWSVWGHHLDKLINLNTLSAVQRSELYAEVNGKRTESQYCFTSELLYSEILKGIDVRKVANPEANFYSIAPNDNAIVCSCEQCMAVNRGANSSSNSLVLLINKLAAKHPDLVFTTHAYLSTIKPPTALKLRDNAIVLISTIDFPKGQPLSKSNKAAEFQTLVESWKTACSKLYVWDYTVQYTNYFDWFPNLSAVQEDLKFFQQLGITGVLEQGSEDQYSLLAEWKSFALSKLLWDPNLDLEKLRYDFIEQAYPTHVDFFTDYLSQLEEHMKKSGKSLNIYGTAYESINSYLLPEAFDLFYYELFEKYRECTGMEKKRYEKVLTALIYMKLEIARSTGIADFGYANLIGGDSLQVISEIPILLKNLHEFSEKANVRVINEVGDSIQTYIQNWNRFCVNRNLKSIIVNKPIRIISKSNGEYKGDAQKALNDAAFGFTDYEVNWLIFDQAFMEVEIPATTFGSGQNISLSFLQDPRHHIYFPNHVEIFAISAGNVRTPLKKAIVPQSQKLTKDVVEVRLDFANVNFIEKIVIVADGTKANSENNQFNNQKISIACDEIQVY